MGALDKEEHLCLSDERLLRLSAPRIDSIAFLQTPTEYCVWKYRNESSAVVRDSLRSDPVESPRCQSDFGVGRRGFASV